jgi:dihydrofolate reductase
MTLISAIVAMDQNRCIGVDNQIPWYLPADLQYFKKTTLGHPVIMGRKSFRSIGRPLPKRTNIVVSRDPFFIASGVLTAMSIAEAIDMAKEENPSEIFIIGGGNIYEQTQALWDRLYLTEVAAAFEGDTFFPQIDPTAWKEVFREAHQADEKNEFAYEFVILDRMKST